MIWIEWTATLSLDVCLARPFGDQARVHARHVPHESERGDSSRKPGKKGEVTDHIARIENYLRKISRSSRQDRDSNRARRD